MPSPRAATLSAGAGSGKQPVAGAAPGCYAAREATAKLGETAMRRLLPFAAAVVATAAVAAEAPEAGRYLIGASAEGFVRLDTRTGATSHCTRQDGVWRCQPVIEEVGPLATRLEALSAEVAGLAASLSDLTVRVDALAERPDHQASAEAVEATPPDADRGVVATAMERLFALVRLLKHGTGEA
jgi:hypothetical protein